MLSPPSRVEWIEIIHLISSSCSLMSPPSRVEWIEIRNLNYRQVQDSRLRLRGWSGLKLTSIISQMVLQLSPPSRVEWIEISIRFQAAAGSWVSAFAGGVD